MTIDVMAVVTAALIAFVLGFIWFAVVFREPYLAGLGKTQEQLDRGPSVRTASAYQLVGNFVTAFVLGWLMVATDMNDPLGGILLGAAAWLGFLAGVVGPMHAFQAFSLKFFAITAGYPLVGFMVMGGVLGLWPG